MVRSRTTRPKGELVLLGVFALFLAAYLVDIHSLPIEGKILSYVLAPPLVLFLLICAAQVLLPRKRPAEVEDVPRVRGPGADADEEAADLPAPLGLGRTIGMGVVLFVSIFLLGFYFGTGLMLLAWFLLFRRFNVVTAIITVVTPLLLYVLFEHLMYVGLYEGYLIELLQR